MDTGQENLECNKNTSGTDQEDLELNVHATEQEELCVNMHGTVNRKIFMYDTEQEDFIYGMLHEHNSQVNLKMAFLRNIKVCMQQHHTHKTLNSYPFFTSVEAG